MLRSAAGLAPLGLICAVVLGAVTPVSANSAGCGKHGLEPGASCGAQTTIQDLSAQTRRPRVTIYRRRVSLPPNAVRQCRAWLAREYRVSGPVITPQMYCWWEY
jgi:uncharacterized lipoprotein YbaY